MVDLSWANGSTQFKRLKEWLDPINSNVQFINGLLGTLCATTLVNNLTLNSPSIVYQDCKVHTTNSIINTGKTTFQASKEAVLFNDFQVNTGAEFEIKTY
jgi:hypothetical protein